MCIGYENEVDALLKTVEKQKESIEDLCSELEEERNALSLAANESMSMVLKWQTEKAGIQREARHFKRPSERKIAHDEQEILGLKHELKKRKQANQSLTTQLQSYKDMMTQEILGLKDELKKREHAIQSLTTELQCYKMTQNQQEDKIDKIRYTAQPHLYTIIKVAREEDIWEQVGEHIYFDLVDHDEVHCFRIQNQMTFNLFKEEVAKEFGVPVEFQKNWVWVKRQNHTFRPHRPLTPQEATQTVGWLRAHFTLKLNVELKLFLEVERGQPCYQDLLPIPPPDHTEEDILIFFKLYDPHKDELRYVGRLFVKRVSKPSEILTILNEMAGFASDEIIELFEELEFEPSVICERIDTRVSFGFNKFENGDIICFQTRPKPESEQKFPIPDVPCIWNM